jgi:hypothetical protein
MVDRKREGRRDREGERERETDREADRQRQRDDETSKDSLSVTHFLQQGPTSRSLQNFPKKYHQLMTKPLTYDPFWRILPIQTITPSNGLIHWFIVT